MSVITLLTRSSSRLIVLSWTAPTPLGMFRRLMFILRELTPPQACHMPQWMKMNTMDIYCQVDPWSWRISGTFKRRRMRNSSSMTGRAMTRDERLYKDPDEFDPERFVKGAEPSDFIFGFGRRYATAYESPNRCVPVSARLDCVPGRILRRSTLTSSRRVWWRP